MPGTRRMRSRSGSHVGLLGPRPTSPGGFYLSRERCHALGRNSALPVGGDLLHPYVLGVSLFALVPRPLYHLVLVLGCRQHRRLGAHSARFRDACPAPPRAKPERRLPGGTVAPSLSAVLRLWNRYPISRPIWWRLIGVLAFALLGSSAFPAAAAAPPPQARTACPPLGSFRPPPGGTPAITTQERC
jgi:hypothetical protein